MKSRLIHGITTVLATSVLALVATFAVIMSQSDLPGDASVAHASETVVVDVGSDWFCSATFQNGVCETTIQTGDTVEWSFIDGVHNSTECGANWSKGGSCEGAVWGSEIAMIPPSTFSRTFDTPGEFYYRCTLHPDSMKGIITVGSLTTPSSTPTPAPPPEPTPTAAPTTSASPAPSPSSAPAEPTPATASPSALGAKGLPQGGGWPGVSGGFDVVGLLIAINLPLAALSFAAFRWWMRRTSAT